MATIYKKGRDKKKRNATYYFDYYDYLGIRRTKKGYTDKSRTEQLAAKLENEALLRKSGMIDPVQEELAQKRNSALESNLSEFEDSLKRRKNTSKHVKLTMGRIRRIVTGCEFQTIGDISAEEVECLLEEAQEEDGFGHRTYNHYAQAFEQFCAWLVVRGDVATNPVKKLPRLNTQTDVRRKRRALTPEEFGKLVESAATSDELIQCYDGETRAKIYILSFLTGLRRGEIASLTPSSFRLDQELATVTVEATISKHRKKDILPLHPDLTSMLEGWMADLAPDEKLFPKLAKRRTSLMVKKDLERAGIPYKTSDGFADFHAAGRHTYITELLRNGVSLAEARALARHSDINQTMDYAHIGIEDQAKAIAKLPSSCQHIVSSSGYFRRPEQSSAGTERHDDGVGDATVNRDGASSSDTEKQSSAPDGSGAEKWRRR